MRGPEVDDVQAVSIDGAGDPHVGMLALTAAAAYLLVDIGSDGSSRRSMWLVRRASRLGQP